MNFKKIIAFLLVFAFSLCALVGCNGGNSSSDNGVDPNAPEEYKQAVKFIEEGKIEEAYTALRAVEDYENTTALLERIKVVYTTEERYSYYTNFDREIIKAVRKYTYDEKGNAVKYEIFHVGENESTDGVEAGSTFYYTYDENNNILREENDYNGVQYLNTYEYNENKQLVKKDELDYYIHEYTYDESGKVIKIITTASMAYLGGTIVTEYSYDENGRQLKRVSTNEEGDVIDSLEHDYDEFGNVVKTITDDDYIIEYEYDKENRVTKETQSYSSGDETTVYTCDYVYDSQGNLIKKTDNGRDTVIEYTYDENGNLIKETYSRTFTDPDGDYQMINIIEYSGYVYFYYPDGLPEYLPAGVPGNA